MRKDFYPELSPFKEGYLDVGDGHEIYYALSGNPKGMPVVSLHGGPGGRSVMRHRRVFDPEKYLIVQFDQRGCGNSKPFGEISDNAWQHLLEDIEKLRKHLNIDKWIVRGGSWGVTLGLLYVQTFPSSVNMMLFSGVFLAEKQEIDWLYLENGMAQFFPKEWDAFAEKITQDQAENPLPFMYDLYKNKPYESFRELSDAFAAREMNACEMQHITAADVEEKKTQDAIDKSSYEEYIASKILVHYMVHNCFLEKGQILKNMHKITHIPMHITQGAYDMVCPPVAAHKLHKSHPESVLAMSLNAGHGMRGLEEALMEASAWMDEKAASL